MKITDASFASPKVHAALAGYDPLDVYADALHFNRYGRWRDGEAPQWSRDLFGATRNALIMGVSAAVAPWLLDQALRGDTAARMALIREMQFRDTEDE